MPRVATQEVNISPVKGLNTEASPLTFPENSFTEGFDIKLDTKARLTRRNGFEYEDSYATEAITLSSSSVVHEVVWSAAGGDGENNFTVVQLGNTLYFYNMSTLPLSANKHATTVSLNTYAVGGASNIQSEEVAFVNGDGVLFVFHPQCEPFYVSYEATGDVISATEISIQIRDLKGVDDSLTVGERPAVLTTEHNYNLDNQGWAELVNDKVGNSSTVDPVDEWISDRSDVPSNADVWWFYKDTTDRYDTDFVDRVSIGNSPAPKGHFLLNPFEEDRSGVSGIEGIDIVTTSGKRPSAGSFFAGRVWYTGISVTGWNSNLYFSQIALDNTAYGKCYQSNDPTSSEQFDLLSSDGGVIPIQDCGTILELRTVANLLLVFATNGVWSISGSEGTGFKATDFAVAKVSEFSVIGAHSIVSVDGRPLWWNTDGIYLINIDATLGTLSVQVVSDPIIKTFISGIPDSEKKYIKGSFNSLTRVITWLYRTTASSTVRQRSEFNAVLNLDVGLQAFYPWTISSGPLIHGIVTTAADSGKKTETFFLTLIPVSTDNYNITFSKEHDTDFLDWTTYDATGTDYSSYVIMGYALSGQALMKFSNNYILFLMDTVTSSSCLVQGHWGYANTEASNRWSVSQEVYANISNVGTQERKLKIRGSGRAIQLKFTSVTGKPFSLVGWITFVISNKLP